MKYLVTGGCGFLGSNLAYEVLDRGDELAVFDNFSKFGSQQNYKWLLSKGEFKLFHGDIRNCNDISSAITDFKPDVIFHLAGQVAMTTSLANPRLDFETNAIGTFNLLDSVRLTSPEAIIIFSSTNKVYGDLENYAYVESDTRYTCPDFPNGFSETIPLNFESPYGCSKGAADQYIKDYNKMYGIQTVVFRHSSMYGDRQFASFDQGWIGWFCQKGLEIKSNIINKKVAISGNGKQVRDVLHVDDMKRLYFLAVKHIEKTKGEIFNIGGGVKNSLSLIELFLLLESYLDISYLYEKLAPRISDQKYFIADIAKAKNLIQWEPLVSKNDGIKKMLAWHQKLSQL